MRLTEAGKIQMSENVGKIRMTAVQRWAELDLVARQSLWTITRDILHATQCQMTSAAVNGWASGVIAVLGHCPDEVQVDMIPVVVCALAFARGEMMPPTGEPNAKW